METKWYENRMIKNLIWAGAAIGVASLPIDPQYKAGLMTLFIAKVDTGRNIAK